MNRDEEKARFNTLSQEEARAIAASLEGKTPEIRSCWNCNGAHDHLKTHDFIYCVMGCGISYIRGIPRPLFAKRFRGEEITDEDMNKYEEALKEEQE